MRLNSRARMCGITLIELMVSMVIGLFMMGAVLYVVEESRVTYRHNDNFGRIQEAGRIGIELMAHDARMAGYFGCLPPRNQVVVKAVPPPASGVDFRKVAAIQGDVYPGSSAGLVDYGALLGVPGSDVVTLRKASNNPINLTGNLATNNANIQVSSNPDNFQAGDLLLITDCSAGDLFRATTVSKGAGPIITIAHAAATNTTPQLSKVYGPDATIMRFAQEMYYLRDSGRTAADGSPIISLFRRNVANLAEAPVELVEGVTNMRAIYGLDVDNDAARTIDTYVLAAAVTSAQWAQIRSVRLEVLVAGEDNVARDAQPYYFNGVVNTPPINGGTGLPDRRLRQSFNVTAAFRNLLN
ncbi:MAG: PilW family protein [Rhodocyclales bacterium]|nr:PilW family protein [Rhodocyclales bacterium]